jgi:hypothetical protein
MSGFALAGADVAITVCAPFIPCVRSVFASAGAGERRFIEGPAEGIP